MSPAASSTSPSTAEVPETACHPPTARDSSQPLGRRLVICDEGHRLKALAGNKTTAALLALRCPRRVLLTGTPVQNNLGEFWAMCELACPDALGSAAAFHRVFAEPVARGRERDAARAERALGAERSAELGRRIAGFVLRRGAEVNAKFLPPLSVYVVFCPPTELQLRLLRGVLAGGGPARDFGDRTLSAINDLKQARGCSVLAARGRAGGESGSLAQI